MSTLYQFRQISKDDLDMKYYHFTLTLRFSRTILHQRQRKNRKYLKSLRCWDPWEIILRIQQRTNSSAAFHVIYIVTFGVILIYVHFITASKDCRNWDFFSLFSFFSLTFLKLIVSFLSQMALWMFERYLLALSDISKFISHKYGISQTYSWKIK